MKKNIITSDDILGKSVVDAQGEVLGVTQKIHIDKELKQIVGITIDQGFMRPDLFVGLECIAQFGIDTIFLNTYPRDKVVGMEVINSIGKLLGHVVSIEYKGKNRIKSIKVKLGSNETVYTSNKIREIGYNVVLKGEKEV